MTALTAAEVLSKARDVLAERGWTQGRSMAPGGEVCLWSALAEAGGGFTIAPHIATAGSLVTRVVGRLVAPWNDDPSTTYEDVILALKQAEELALEQAS